MSDMASQEFSSDIIFEILTRTSSLETLDACKSVCKEWKKLVYESSFMPLYCKRTRNFSGYFIQDMKKNKYLSMFVSFDNQSKENCVQKFPCDMKILASCNQGILCCLRRKGKNYRYYASKPATQQWQPLPNPKLRYQTTALAMKVLRSNPLRYKIVRLSQHGFEKTMMEDYKYRCEIFDSENWRWRETQHVCLPYTEIIRDSQPSISVGNSFYWLTSQDNVLEFKEFEETFRKFPLPEVVHGSNGYESKKLVEYEGKLGLTCLTENGNKMELWLTEKNDLINQTMDWRKKMVVNIESLGRNVNYPSPTSFYNAGITFLKAFKEVIFYKLQDCSFSEVKLINGMRYANEVFQFRSDLEHVDLRRIM